MAGFKFNMVDQQLGGDDGKANIFGGGDSAAPEAPAGGPTAQSAPAPMSGGAPAPAGSGGGPQAAAKAPAAAGGGPSGVSQGLRAASSKMKLPDAPFQRIQGELTGAANKLQTEANAYTQEATKTAGSFGLGKDVLESAAGGDEKAFGQVGQRLAKTQADPFKSFAGLGADTPTAANSLLDPASIYESASNNNYTAGQQRLDTALLRRNNDFKNIQSQLLGEQEELAKTSDKMAVDKTKEAREIVDKGYQGSTEEIREELGGMSEASVAGAKQKEIDEDIRRMGLDPRKIGREQYEKLAAQLRQDYAGAGSSLDGRALADLDPGQDLSNYVNIDRDTDWREFVDESSAGRFNRINSLLGTGGEVLSPGAGGGSDFTMDQGGAVQALMNSARGKRQGKDMAAQSRIDQIMGGREAGGKSAINAELSKILGGEYAFNQGNLDTFDYTPFLRDAGSGYGQGEAAELNALYKDMGLRESAAASGPQFDTPAMLDAWRKYLPNYGSYEDLMNDFARPMAPAVAGGRGTPNTKVRTNNG